MPGNVRKVLLASLAAALLLLPACGSAENAAITSPGTKSSLTTPATSIKSQTTTTTAKTTAADTAKSYNMGDAIPFGGGTFVIKSARKAPTLVVTPFKTEKTYTPKQGTYVVVYFTFQGKADNDKTGVDPLIMRLKDSNGKTYAFSTALNNYETNDLALFAEKKGLLSMCLWSNPALKDLLQVYDVNSSAKGIVLEFIDSSAKVHARVDLGL